MSIVPSPPANATPTARGLMSAADKAYLDTQSGTNSGDVTVSSPAGWLSLVGQALTFALVSASASVAGVVDLAAQTFAGVKTFTSAIIASAGVQLASLWNTNGTGASDVGVKVGVSTADASVNATAKLLSVRTGIGGTEGEYVLVRKNYTQINASSAGAVLGVRNGNSGGFSGIEYLATNDSPIVFSGVQLSTNQFRFNNIGTGGYTDFMIASVTRLRISNAGGIDIKGGDSSATPGNATLSYPQGKSAIASGAATVRITNSLVALGDQVHITWHGDHGQTRDWVTTGAGFFDVNLNAAASANTAFCWTVSKRI